MDVSSGTPLQTDVQQRSVGHIELLASHLEESRDTDSLEGCGWRKSVKK